ncbi:MAG: 5-deoxy-glucuronate isomerase [Planctomycetota bacterium]
MTAPRFIEGAAESERCTVFRDDAARWITGLRVLDGAGGEIEHRTGESEESGLVVLTGTHDLEANSGGWASRGTRATPYEGRPVTLYLPPKARLRVAGGTGELVLVSARRPEIQAAPAVEPEPAPAKKPLLPLAGSNKAFDTASGSWQPIESFPDSAEAIPPRRASILTIDGVETRWVFPVDYKALGLCVFEAVLAEGQTLSLPGQRHGAYPEEWAVYCRTEGRALLAGAGNLDDRAAAFGVDDATLTATSGRCYVLAALAGHKP